MTIQVVIIGAGIVGAAVSHQVARIGAKVRVLDVVGQPGQGAATRSTWAWLNANKKHPKHYRDLNLAGLQRWKAEWPALVHSCGSLLFDDDDEASLSDPVYPGQHVGPEQLRQLEPFVSEEMGDRGAHLFPQEAWVDPQVVCREMLSKAKANGADVLLGPTHQVMGLLTRTEEHVARVTGVVTADGTTHPADVVVVAAGAETMPLAALAGVQVPLLHKPAVVAITSPLTGADGLPRQLTRHLISTAKVFVWQRPDGSLMLGDTRAHEDGSTAWGESLLQRAAELVPELVVAGARVERVEVAYRPWPKDGHPIIGPSSTCRGLYIATMHSGMTLAPEVARLVAAELRHWDVAAGVARGSEAELLEAQAVLRPYRLDRDFEEGARRAAYAWK
ncbi:hypothetical protein VaNZ11_012872 [Volvox africanus]|uniref:FAD dependent oxidoreductase domain-containing protein n=1 Tax=Volvox africanus TaxID=51714 RepID=A0ABQ5SGY6_9CHLO|nr:hypothetical protein VaNZ11_012872 [Volvox africanus]